MNSLIFSSLNPRFWRISSVCSPNNGGLFLIVLSESDNKTTVVLLGPGPENTLGMIPGNLILSDGITSINITNPGYEAMVTN